MKAAVAIGLGLLGLVLLVLGTWLATNEAQAISATRHEDEEAGRATGALFDASHTAGDVLEALIEHWEELVYDDGTGWEELQAVLREPGTPPDAVLEIYHLDDDDEVAMIGRIRATQRPTRDDPLLPEDFTRSLLATEREEEDGGEDFLWFTQQGDAVFLDRLRMVDLEGEEHEDDEDAELERFLFFLRSALPAPADTRMIVECDMQGDRLVSPAIEAVLPGSLAAGDVTDEALGLDFEDLEGRRPTAHEGWSALLYLPPAAGVGRTPYLLAILGALLGLGGLFLLWSSGGSAPPPPPDLSGEAAHEMRTPLTVMRGKLEVALRRERDAEQYQKTLRECLDELEGLEQLQDSILLLTKTRPQDIPRETIDIHALVRAEAKRLQDDHPEREITLRSSGRPPIQVEGDPSLLARAIGNLLDNAAAHSTVGGMIRIRLHAELDQVRIVVEDDGPGVPQERHDLIFERFYRGPDVGRRGIAGSGLGLPIVRRIAELHAGTVVYEPAKPGTSRFVLTLPRADAK